MLISTLVLIVRVRNFVCLMVFSGTCNNSSAISWWSVSLVEETGEPRDKLYHIMLYTSPWSRFELTTLVLICTDCIGSCKSNYHANTPQRPFVSEAFLTNWKSLKYIILFTFSVLAWLVFRLSNYLLLYMYSMHQ